MEVSIGRFHSSVISEEEVAVNFQENQLSEEEETRDNLEPLMVSEEIVMVSGKVMYLIISEMEIP